MLQNVGRRDECLTRGNCLQVCVQPVQVPRYNAEPETADGEEEGQATSQEKGTNLGKPRCFDSVVDNAYALHEWSGWRVRVSDGDGPGRS